MGSIRRLLLVAAATIAIGGLVPSVSAADKSFHLAKTCSGFTCTITSSTFKGVPEGTQINYSETDTDALVAVIGAPNGTATGNCNIASVFDSPSSPGTCTFDMGTGSLSAFHLRVAVTYDASTDVWYWDGTYTYGLGG